MAGLGAAPDAGAQNVARYVRESGRINFVTTGGSLRNSATNTCSVNANSTTALSGIPADTTIRAAYLYWGGSGATAVGQEVHEGPPGFGSGGAPRLIPAAGPIGVRVIRGRTRRNV